MLHLLRHYSFKIIAVIFLFFSLAKAQGEQIAETEKVLHGFASSLGELKDNDSFGKAESASLLGFLSEIKEDLNCEKNKLEEFEDSFWNLCNLLKKSDCSKEEKLKRLSTNVQDLNRLLDSSDLIIGLDQELKKKIILLGDLIRLFINNDELDLEKLEQDFQSITQAIEAIAQFLDSDVYNKQKIDKEPVVDTKLDEVAQRLDAQHLDAQHLDAQHLNAQHSQDIEDHHMADGNIDQEEAGKIINEEIVVLGNTDIDNITYEDETLNKELQTPELQTPESQTPNREFIQKQTVEDEKVQKREAKRLLNIDMQDVKKAGKVAAKALKGIGDYRLGGYPVQFVHQLLRHMDKVYNK